MRIIVDANIVFSAILKTNGKIADILINSGKDLTFIAPYFLKHEIRKHYPKLVKISKLTLEQVQEAESLICQNIHFISEEQIKISHWISAEKLVADIDPNDIQYIAFSKHFRCKIWSGDKVLTKGLLKKNFSAIISTEELFTLKNS